MGQDINSVIEQLAKIDSASAKIMQKAQQEKSAYADRILQQKQQFDSTLQSKVDAEVAAFQTSMDKEREEQIAKYKVDCNRDIAALEQHFQAHKTEWVDTIFNQIIKE